MKWLQLIFTYLPSVLSTVVAIENAIQAPGATKKQLVLDVITAGSQAAEKIPESHVSGIAALIDVIVGTLNRAGVFTKGVPSTTSTIGTTVTTTTVKI